MERLAYAITDHLLRRDVIQKEDYDIYVYGYAVFLEQMCQVLLYGMLDSLNLYFVPSLKKSTTVI